MGNHTMKKTLLIVTITGIIFFIVQSTFCWRSEYLRPIVYLGKTLGYSNYTVKEVFPRIYMTSFYNANKQWIDQIHTDKELTAEELVEKLGFLLSKVRR